MQNIAPVEDVIQDDVQVDSEPEVSETPEAVEQINETVDPPPEFEPGQSEQEEQAEPEQEATQIPEPEFSEEQKTWIEAQIKQKNEQIKKTDDHWKKVIAKQAEELGQRRKNEHQLAELEQKDRELAEAETANEYNVDELVRIKTERAEVQKQRNLALYEQKTLETKKIVPDFDELAKTEYMAEAIRDYAATRGVQAQSSAEIREGIKMLRANPVLAPAIALAARTKQQAAELSGKSKRISKAAKTLGDKVSRANESTVLPRSRPATKTTYTDADINSMSSAERQELIKKGRQKGAFKT